MHLFECCDCGQHQIGFTTEDVDQINVTLKTEDWAGRRDGV
jgi:hypothetical protein